MNEHGCSTKVLSHIHIRSALYMANAFTPDGDGHNDVFRIPEGTTLTLHKFEVFDRWGNRVFSTRNINEVWNGMFNARPSPADVYVYLISDVDDKGPVHQKGTVVLIR